MNHRACPENDTARWLIVDEVFHTGLFHTERQQDIPAGGAAADAVAGSDVHHPVDDDSAAGGDLSTARRCSVNSFELLRGIELPELFAIGSGDRVEHSI